MKTLILLLLFSIPSIMSAEYVSSAYSKKYVAYIAEVGSTVKKGQPLFKLKTGAQKLVIRRLKLQLQDAFADLQDKKSDRERSAKLLSKKIISASQHENVVVAYHKAYVKYEELKIKIKQQELSLGLLVTNAPYDCKVIRHLICPNSGVDYGTYILKIQPLGAKPDSSGNNESSRTMKVLSGMSGEIISYLPEAGQIVKKGEPLIKWNTTIVELDIKSLKSTLKEAKECLTDANTDIKRTKYLHSSKVISKKTLEDVSYLYTKCYVAVEIIKLDIEDTNDIKNYNCVLRAPYNVKVVKCILSVGSGTKVGRPVLEVQKSH